MSNDRPVIGIVTALEQTRFGAWDVPAALSPFSYVMAVQRAGGLAIMIPPDPAVAEHPDQLLDTLDGLMLAGGSDVGPGTYGQAAHPETAGIVPARDEIELALIKRAIERDIPVLGICRGMQVLNIAQGGTLIQHLPDVVGHGEHRRHLGSFDGSEHDVALDPGTLAAKAAGEERHSTKSHHHQGIDALGDGLVITGRSTLDELPEAIESPEHRYVLGVQWHPEADPTSSVVESLVDEARQYRASRNGGPPPAA
jgi:putative glutamine amidotransferase